MKRIGIINRGEPAIRFLNALDALRREEVDAPESVALYTDADAESVYVRSADHAIRIGEGRTAYLDAEGVVDALLATECDAAWLGWGFASEDGEFCEQIERAGITLLAPRPETMTALGDKISAKQLAEQHGVPVAPWAIVEGPDAAVAASETIGFPLLLKAAGGGGGRGIRLVERIEDVSENFVSARDEAARSFRSEGVFMERFVKRARHIEVQVLGDGEGGVRVLGVRDCSLQRRRQKVIEECPAPGLGDDELKTLVTAAHDLCAAVKYRSAGTVEFLYDLDLNTPYFLEVNTRLQVEHPVTEEVFGVDLVRAQIDLARGKPFYEGDITPRGWAIEARVCAEDAQNNFTPAPGRLVRFVLPSGPGLRVDTGFTEGDDISADFDPLIAKIIAWGRDRRAAMARLSRALEHTRIVVDGGTSNLAFLRALLVRDDVREGQVDIGLVDRLRVDPPTGAGIAMIAAAIDRFMTEGDRGDGFDRHRVEAGQQFMVYRTGPTRFRLFGDGGAISVERWEDGPYQSWVKVDGIKHRVERAPGDINYTVDGVPHRVAKGSAGAVSAPSAALVLNLPVQEGAQVNAGDCVIVLESMKMEVRVEAALTGTVREVLVGTGAQVKSGQTLIIIDGDDEDKPLAVNPVAIPWESGPSNTMDASLRVTAAMSGWDFNPKELKNDCERLAPDACEGALNAFVDMAELFERRPTRQKDGGGGATDAVTPDVWLETLNQRGPDSLSSASRAILERVLTHFDVKSLEHSDARNDALLRIKRAGLSLPATIPAAVILLRRLEEAPIDLLDRLTSLDPQRFGTVREAADRARYVLFERLAHLRLLTRAEHRARALLTWLREGRADWDEVLEAPESLVPGFAPEAAQGCEIAAEAVARRLEWVSAQTTCQKIQLGERIAFRLEDNHRIVICASGRPHEAAHLIDAARQHGAFQRLDLVLVPQQKDDAHEVLEAILNQVNPTSTAMPPWNELCLIVVSGNRTAVRRFYADGSERTDRRDVTPSTARRLDLDRLARFDFQRLPSDDDVVLFLATAWENPRDVRFLAFGEVRSLERAPGHPLHLPHVERVFHAAVRSIEAAREHHDPRKRRQWNRITLSVAPVVPMAIDRMRAYIERLAPAALGIGLEKVVVRARFRDKNAEDGNTSLMDLKISRRPGGDRLDFKMTPASHDPLMPLTDYESQIVAARRRGLTHPYEVIRLLETSPRFPIGTFEEYDLDPSGQLRRVAGRPYGGNDAGVVFGVMRSRSRILGTHITRVLLLSDPTQRMGALAEAECRRVVAAIDLAERLQLPGEWVAVSAGARIDWHSGTENLDWTARVLSKLIQFTQNGGEVNLIVPGICVGAQAYWNAEATMLMHTRGMLIMTNQGTMVLTGKRALDFSGCVSAEDDLALGGYTSVMGPNGQAQAHAADLGDAYHLLYRYYELTYTTPGSTRPVRILTKDATQRDIGLSEYPGDLGHGFTRVGEIFSNEHNPDRKRPFAIRPVMSAVADQDCESIERWSAFRGGETVVVWESRIGGYAATLIGIENQPLSRLGQKRTDGPDTFAGGTLYPQASRKLARALNAASGRRPVVVLANLSGFDGSPESLRNWQLEYGAEIGRSVVNFDGPILFIILSRYHGGAYVVFSKALNPKLTSVAHEGSYASVIGGAPAAAVVFAGEVRKRAAEMGGTAEHHTEATAELAMKFDNIHSVERARQVGSIDGIISSDQIRGYIVNLLEKDVEAAAPRTLTSPPVGLPTER
ncbi:MAG: carboxyl transferase domain-containing protein [Myxococcota bacterium]|nr:carboxyl transferase domain-containing protein [Myxococcota bacterium]